MIGSKNELKFYLAADKFALGIDQSRPGSRDHVWKFQILLRKVEYYKNASRGLLNRLFLKYHSSRMYKLGIKLGFDIPPGVFGAGLRINHSGNIVVNGEARVGMWCDIHQGVNIGTNAGDVSGQLVPELGRNVWIGPGAKIFGDIKVGSGAVIGANAVVGKSFRGNITIAGIPARVVKDTGSEKLNVAASIKRMNTFFQSNPEFSEYRPEENEVS